MKKVAHAAGGVKVTWPLSWGREAEWTPLIDMVFPIMTPPPSARNYAPFQNYTPSPEIKTPHYNVLTIMGGGGALRFLYNS